MCSAPLGLRMSLTRDVVAVRVHVDEALVEHGLEGLLCFRARLLLLLQLGVLLDEAL